MRPWTLLFLLACGGVPGSSDLVDLTTDDALKLCQQVHQNERTIECGGPQITFPESDDQACAERVLSLPPSCSATAGDFRDCRKARRAGDACEPSTEPIPECEWEASDSCFRDFLITE